MASGNAGKLREFSRLLNPLGLTLRPQKEWSFEEAIEDGLTFIENALIKARHAAKHTGLPALADDSGLVVDALDGRPGIFSARFSGENADSFSNNQKLLDSMKDIPGDSRSAHFYCALALMRHAADPSPIIATGAWFGLITRKASGEHGFGYDPLFWVPEHECTSAQLDPDVKNRFSHRGQAMKSLVQQLRQEKFE